MALIKCNECGKKISDKAKICIHCGHRKKAINNKKIFVIILLCILFLIIIFAFVFKNNRIKEISGEWYNVTYSKYYGGADTYRFLTLNKDKTCEYSLSTYFQGETLLPYSTKCKWKRKKEKILLYYDNNEKLAEFKYNKNENALIEFDKESNEELRTYIKR